METDNQGKGAAWIDYSQEAAAETEARKQRKRPISLISIFLTIFAIVLAVWFVLFFTTSPLYTQLEGLASGFNVAVIKNICTPFIDYTCLNPTLSNGDLTFLFGQNIGPILYNVTLYSSPFSANFTLNNTYDFPRSATISSIYPGTNTGVVITGGIATYEIPVKGTYTGNLWVVYYAGGVRSLQRVGTITATSGS